MDIERLLLWVEPLVDPDFVPTQFDDSAARGLLAAAGPRSAPDHARFLKRWNGAYARGGSLHWFGARPAPPNQSLDCWNRPDGWRQAFGVDLDGVFFFAETGFGDQFGYQHGKVVCLRSSDLRMERCASNFAEWLEDVFLDPTRWLGSELFDACVARLGALPRGGHFAPIPPWTAGSPRSAAQMEVVPARDSMEMKGVGLMSTGRASRVGGSAPPAARR